MQNTDKSLKETIIEQPLIVKKGYKYRFYPTNEQKDYLNQVFGANRFVWNKLVELINNEYKLYQEQLKLEPLNKPSYPDTSGYRLCNEVTKLKQEHEWMKSYPSVPYQQTALHLGGAYTTFFRGRKLSKKPGKPKFKNRTNKQSISLTTFGFRLKGKELYIAKCKEPILPIWSRELPSYPTSCSIYRTPSNEYYVSFTCEMTPKKTSGTKVIGIDLGLTHLAILSDGTKIDNPKYYQNTEHQLKLRQRDLSRKVKGSNNRNKARLKVAKLHSRISNQRKDYLHKLTTSLVNDSQVIGLESLQVSNMLRNHKLAKGIQSASWSMLVSQIAYKAKESQHCVVVMMDKFFPSSHLCSVTGKKLNRKLSLKERSWECPHCNEVHDRDVNAAQNIAIEAMYQCDLHGLLKIPHTGVVFLASKRDN